MANDAQISEEHAGEILLHFDVPQHSIPLGQFVKSAQAIQAIIGDFNKNYFDDELKYELHVVPPEKGGLEEIVRLVLDNQKVLWTATTVWALIGTDIGKGFIKGLTGHEPRYFAEKLGEKAKNLFGKKEQFENIASDDDEPDNKDEADNKIVSILIALIIARMVIGFLAKEPEALQKEGITKKKHRDAYLAKNDIMQTCVDNTEVNGLGFDRSHDFPIKRSDFPKHIVDVPPVEPEDKEVEWVVGETDIVAYSPNWKKDTKRGWLGDTSDFKEVNFSIEDDAFWGHVLLKDIHPEFYDNMKVQWAYKTGSSIKPSSARVLRVLTYNGDDLSDPMNDEELAEALGDFSHLPPSDQTEMFETAAKKEPPKQTIRIRKD